MPLLVHYLVTQRNKNQILYQIKYTENNTAECNENQIDGLENGKTTHISL